MTDSKRKSWVNKKWESIVNRPSKSAKGPKTKHGKRKPKKSK